MPARLGLYEDPVTRQTLNAGIRQQRFGRLLQRLYPSQARIEDAGAAADLIDQEVPEPPEVPDPFPAPPRIPPIPPASPIAPAALSRMARAQPRFEQPPVVINNYYGAGAVPTGAEVTPEVTPEVEIAGETEEPMRVRNLGPAPPRPEVEPTMEVRNLGPARPMVSDPRDVGIVPPTSTARRGTRERLPIEIPGDIPGLVRRYSPFDEIFRRYSPHDLIDNTEFMAIVGATTRAESGWRPEAVGDGGASAGIFQMHEAGAGHGMSVEQRQNPDQASARMIPIFAEHYRRVKAERPDFNGAELMAEVARRAERPALSNASDAIWRQSPAYQNYVRAWRETVGGAPPTPYAGVAPAREPEAEADVVASIADVIQRLPASTIRAVGDIFGTLGRLTEPIRGEGTIPARVAEEMGLGRPGYGAFAGPGVGAARLLSAEEQVQTELRPLFTRLQDAVHRMDAGEPGAAVEAASLEDEYNTESARLRSEDPFEVARRHEGLGAAEAALGGAVGTLVGGGVVAGAAARMAGLGARATRVAEIGSRLLDPFEAATAAGEAAARAARPAARALGMEVPPGVAQEVVGKPSGLAARRAEVAALEVPGVQRIVNTLDPQWEGADLGTAGWVQGGTLHAIHVTDDPSRATEILTSGSPIRLGRGEERFGDLGRGLYASAAPQLWMGRAEGKWDFLQRLNPDERQRLADTILADPHLQPGIGYVADFEREYLARDLQEFVAGRGLYGPIAAAEQPFNVRSWEPAFLQKIGIGPSERQPFEVPMRLRGQFAELARYPSADEVDRLVEAGVDGAFVRAGFGAEPQVVVWNNAAIAQFGDYRNPRWPLEYPHPRRMPRRDDEWTLPFHPTTRQSTLMEVPPGEGLRAERVTPFYSQLQRTINERMPNRASAEQVQGLLRNSPVKEEEIRWTGLDDFLAERAGQAVTKQEVQDHLRQNEVRVEEVLRSVPRGDAEASAADFLRTARRLDIPREQAQSWRDQLIRGQLRIEVLPVGLRAAGQELADLATRTPTRYHTYQLPGGENYRELLLTLPERPGDPLTRGDFAITLKQKYGERYLDHMDEWTPEEIAAYGALPGNYSTRAGELIPRPSRQYRSPHWDEPNVLAHVRFNARTDTQGRRLLFIEEVQSDWHQAGREKGYRGIPLTGDEVARYKFLETLNAHSRAALTDAERTEMIELAGRSRAWAEGPPEAPFTKTWPELVMKRMLRWGAENGFDKIAWTRGEQQADRYNLSRAVKRIEWTPATRIGEEIPTGILRATPVHGGPPIAEYDITYTRLRELIGTDLRDRLLSQPAATPATTRVLEGDDLRVGGEGMRIFYDQMLPQIAGRLGKKWGTRVSSTTIDFRKVGTPTVTLGPTGWMVRAPGGELIISTGNEEEARRAFTEWIGRRGGDVETRAVHSIDITPEMKRSVLTEGQPLFLRPRAEGEAGPPSLLGPAARGAVGAAYTATEEEDTGPADFAARAVLGAVGGAARGALGRRLTPSTARLAVMAETLPPGHTVARGLDDPNQLYEFRYRVLPLDSLITSQRSPYTGEINPAFPTELQPRDRSRIGSRVQIERMARGMVPDQHLIDVQQLDRGPAIIGPDNVVESGNGRILSLRAARELAPEKFTEYEESLRQRLASYGLAPEDLEGIRDPVLVRERITPVDRVRFAQEANQSTSLAFTASETAISDAARLPDPQIAAMEVPFGAGADRALLSTANRRLLLDFVSALPENERLGLLTRDGDLSQDGLNRFKAALFARTYPGEAGHVLQETFLESLDFNIHNVERAVEESMPAMAKAEALIRQGSRIPELTLTDDLARAVSVFARLRQQGVPVSEYLAQGALFARELNPAQEALLARIGELSRSPRMMREFFESYAQQVIESPHAAQGTMFAGMTPPTKREILERLDIRIPETEDLPLFAGAPAAAPTAREGLAPAGRGVGAVAPEGLAPRPAVPEAAPPAPAGPGPTPSSPEGQSLLADLTARIRILQAAIRGRAETVPNLRDFGLERRADYEQAIDAYHTETRRLEDEMNRLAQQRAGLRLSSRSLPQQVPVQPPVQPPAPRSPLASPDDIARELARDAFQWSSMDPGGRGEAVRKEFADTLNSLQARLLARATPDQRPALEEALQSFKAGYRQRYTSWLAARGRVASPMVTGRAKFPEARNARAIETEQKRSAELEAFRKKGEHQLFRLIQGTAGTSTGAIPTGEQGAAAALTQRAAAQASEHELMVKANEQYRALLKQEGQATAIRAVRESLPESLRREAFSDPFGKEPIPFAPYQITNARARAQRLAGQVGRATELAATPTSEISGPGLRIVDNAEAGRVQVIFDQKPDVEMLAKLRGRGFRWAPSEGAWQRERTPQALADAKRIVGLEGVEPAPSPIAPPPPPPPPAATAPPVQPAHVPLAAAPTPPPAGPPPAPPITPPPLPSPGPRIPIPPPSHGELMRGLGYFGLPEDEGQAIIREFWERHGQKPETISWDTTVNDLAPSLRARLTADQLAKVWRDADPAALSTAMTVAKDTLAYYGNEIATLNARRAQGTISAMDTLRLEQLNLREKLLMLGARREGGEIGRALNILKMGTTLKMAQLAGLQLREFERTVKRAKTDVRRAQKNGKVDDAAGRRMDLLNTLLGGEPLGPPPARPPLSPETAESLEELRRAQATAVTLPGMEPAPVRGPEITPETTASLAELAQGTKITSQLPGMEQTDLKTLFAAMRTIREASPGSPVFQNAARRALEILELVDKQAAAAVQNEETRIAKMRLQRALPTERLSPAAMAELERLDWSDPVAIGQTAELFKRWKQGKRTAGERATEIADQLRLLRMASVLSGTGTQLVNAMGGGFMLAHAYPQRLVAGALSESAGALFGPRGRAVIGEAYMSQAGGEAAGMVASLDLAAREFQETLRTGISPYALRDLPQLTTADPIKLPAMGLGLNWVFRLMGASDALVRSLGEGMSLYAEAERVARKSGTSREAILNNLLAHPDIVERAAAAGKERVFQQDLPQSLEFINLARRNPFIGSLVLFFKTPTNIARRSLEISPAGFVKALVTKDPAERAQAYADSVIGTALAGLGYALAQSGLMSAFGPPETPEFAGQRRALQELGWTKNAVLVGDHYVPILNLIGPHAVPMIMGASVAEIARYAPTDQQENTLKRVSAGVSKFLVDQMRLGLSQTSMKGVSDLMEALTSTGGTRAERYLESLSTSVVPYGGLLATMARVTDITVRNPEDPLEAMMARIPGLSQEVAPSLTRYGEVRQRAVSGPLALLPIAGVRKASTDPVHLEALRLEEAGHAVSPNFVGKNLSYEGERVQLTPEEWRDYQQMAGQLHYRVMSSVVSRPEYQVLPNFLKAQQWQSVEDLSRETARKLVRPRLIPRAIEQKQEQLQRNYQEIQRARQIPRTAPREPVAAGR